MKILKMLPAALVSFFWVTPGALSCPNPALSETELDCPWAEISRTLQTEKGVTSKTAVFKKMAGKLFLDIQSESSRKEIQALWGRSLNYDEFAKSLIVDPEILDMVFDLAKAPKRDDRVVHAGLEHTYGYILSTLQTAFGYKRARWVREDIENGFGLPRGILGPNPKKGTLFLNVSYFMSKLVKGNEAVFSNWVKKLPVELVNLKVDGLKKRTLQEELKLEDGKRTVELITELFEFSKKPADAKANSQLLIYWIKDSTEFGPKLITLFPVTDDFVVKVFDSKNLGENQPIVTRYNGFVGGVTGAATPLKGMRRETKY